MKAIIILLTTAISVALGLPISFPDFRQIKRVDDQDFYGEAQQGNPMSDNESDRGTDDDKKRPSLACQKLMLQTMPEELDRPAQTREPLDDIAAQEP
ncbi:hypothetical protein NQZ79_g1279 [Umbelopsis isabellina]|nr:hypothetical protein NQZ79_g1279 [Umbelopsis isabellina]